MFVHNINPVLFEIGPLTIYYYGLMYAILFLCSYLLGQWYFKRHGKSTGMTDTFLLIVIIAVIVGARLGHVFFYSWPYYSQNPLEILYVWQGGLASHGATIGLIIGVWVMNRMSRWGMLFLGDIVCLCSSLAVVFVRIGNFINGEIVGRVTDSPFGVVFPCNGLVRGICGAEARHPSQIYEALVGLVMFGVMMWVLLRFKKVKPGVLSGIFLVGYFGARFFLEFFKEYDGTIFLPPLTNGQVLSIPAVGLGIFVLWWVLRRKRA